MPFDFGILNNSSILLLIEYDGIQHYKSIEYFGGMESLKSQQRRDKIKNEYCNENKIPLLRIPYWNYDNIVNILNEIFKNIKS